VPTRSVRLPESAHLSKHERHAKRGQGPCKRRASSFAALMGLTLSEAKRLGKILGHVGFSTGALWMCGGQRSEFESAMYMNLGVKLSEDTHILEGAVEILASEYDAALQKFQGQKKAT
jgi:DNA helicase TIP49 (TBP-interacting protein)